MPLISGWMSTILEQSFSIHKFWLQIYHDLLRTLIYQLIVRKIGPETKIFTDNLEPPLQFFDKFVKFYYRIRTKFYFKSSWNQNCIALYFQHPWYNVSKSVKIDENAVFFPTWLTHIFYIVYVRQVIIQSFVFLIRVALYYFTIEFKSIRPKKIWNSACDFCFQLWNCNI